MHWSSYQIKIKNCQMLQHWLFEFSWIILNFLELASICMALLEFAWICWNFLEFSGICLNLVEFGWIYLTLADFFLNFHEFASIFVYSLEFALLCLNLIEFATFSFIFTLFCLIDLIDFPPRGEGVEFVI